MSHSHTVIAPVKAKYMSIALISMIFLLTAFVPHSYSSTTYSYDDLNRLKTVMTEAGQIDFSYDTVGNITRIVSTSYYIVYEDGEDEDTAGWSVYDNDPAGATITNVFDTYRQSQVIEFTGAGKTNGYRRGLDDGSDWHNTTQSTVQWSMNYAEDFTVYIDVETALGHRYIYYTPDDFSGLGTEIYVHHGLRISAKDGQWHTFTRDLQADLDEAQPGNTILEVNGFFIRGSGRVDDIALLSAFPNADSDQDGIADYDEIYTYATDFLNPDSDGDGIDDGAELTFWGVYWNADPDSDDIINLLDFDSDNDGYFDNYEITEGTDPADALSSPSLLIYEDAENGDTAGWFVYDNDPAGATINNVFDIDRQSQVIEFTGTGKGNGYWLSMDDGSDWHNTTFSIIQWSMNYAEDFVVLIDVETTLGHRYIYYTPDDFSSLGSEGYIHHGLWASAIDGQWHTFTRDLQADLDEAQPGNTILEVNGFLIKGSGRVDDIGMQ